MADQFLSALTAIRVMAVLLFIICGLGWLVTDDRSAGRWALAYLGIATVASTIIDAVFK